MSARRSRLSTIPGVGAARASDGGVQPAQAVPDAAGRGPLAGLELPSASADNLPALAGVVGFRVRLVAVADLKG